MSLHQPSGHFTLHKVFSPVTHLGFGVWGTPGSRVWVWGVMLALRTFPELVWRSVQNLVEIGPPVRACKGDIERHFYRYRLHDSMKFLSGLLGLMSLESYEGVNVLSKKGKRGVILWTHGICTSRGPLDQNLILKFQFVQLSSFQVHPSF